MVGNLTGALRTAQSGLLTNQSALEAVANNIANVNTEGYSRKDIKLEARVVSGNGAGVQLGEVRRVIDEGLLKNLRSESATYEMLSSQGIYYERMQEMFGAPGDNTSIGHLIGEFTESMEASRRSFRPDTSLPVAE